MNLNCVVKAFWNGNEIVAIWSGDIFVWPDPWEDIWDEGFYPRWSDTWSNTWPLSICEIGVDPV